MGTIYLIRNTINNKCYIGQTTRDVKKRIREHLFYESKGNSAIKNALEKYGHNAFTYEILHDDVDNENLDLLEKQAITEFNTLSPNGYNLATGGNKNKTFSNETKEKMSKNNRMRSPKERQKHSETMRGKPCSEHVKDMLLGYAKGNNFRVGISPVNKGVPMSEKQKRKVSRAKKGKPNIKKRHPDREKAHELFDSLSMSITEKRKIISKAFPHVNYKTIWRWTISW